MLAVLAWVVVPATRTGTQASNVSTGARPTASPGSSSGNRPANSAGGTPGQASGASSSASTNRGSGATGNGDESQAVAGSAAAACPPASGPGITDSEVRVAVLLVNAGGIISEQAFGVPGPEEQQKLFQAVVDSVNDAGGAGCRKVVPVFMPVNAVDQSALQQACLDVQQAGVFAVFDMGAYTAFQEFAKCYPQAGIPLFSSWAISQSFHDDFYPYSLTPNGIVDVELHNAAFAFKERNFFDPASGFKKLGIIYRSCVKSFFESFRDAVRQAGVPDDLVTAYDFGCSSAVFANPNDVQQAVFTFQHSNPPVTHVVEIDDNPDLGTFTNVAERQGFRPQYGIPDETAVATTTSVTANYNPNNLDKALAIIMSSYGEYSTPGAVPAPGTAKCDAIYTARGMQPTYQQGAGIGGVACSLMWMFQTALDHAPTIGQSTLVDGLHAAGSSDWSYPDGPNDFSAPDSTTGGQFWRPVQYVAGCKCWNVSDFNFRGGFS